MAKIGKSDPNYDWAEKHITDFERYLAEQCQPYFEEVAAEDSSKFMAPMWWSVGYVILRGMADKQSIPADDTDTLIDRAMLLLQLLTQSQHLVFYEIRQTFVLPMAKALNIEKDNDAINQHILKSIAYILDILLIKHTIREKWNQVGDFIIHGTLIVVSALGALQFIGTTAIQAYQKLRKELKDELDRNV